jgi:hypothetical protein
MKRASVLRLLSAYALFWIACCSAVTAQQTSVTMDWNAELAKAKAGIEKDPKSAFWHNQAGVAYNALGEFENAVKEIKLACTLDESNPNSYYTLYALYKRK